MKCLFVAALLAVTASQAIAGESVVLGSSVIMCREAIHAELVQGRLKDKDTSGALQVAREGGCLPVTAGTEITIIGSSAKFFRIEAPMLDTTLVGYIARPKTN